MDLCLRREQMQMTTTEAPVATADQKRCHLALESRQDPAGTEDRAAPRPDLAADLRWGAALRAVDTRTPITREKPEVTRDATEAVTLTVTDGSTQAGTRQGTTMVTRSSVHAAKAELRTDIEVNDPHWDSHVC